ncbi:MAG: hypothetical protein J6T82_03055 [Bacteroidaceae bacterium]|nr:hypothetical protein [Bacteroidaceae bacterium]
MMTLQEIDIDFDFRLDSKGKDPDSSSPTMKAYHQLLWSKPLPNGQTMALTSEGCSYLRWNDMYFGSDSITASFRYMASLMEKVRGTMPDFDDFIEYYLGRAYTIGGEIIFPQLHWSMNQARGCSPRIRDRWDLTLECIKRFYEGGHSPLDRALERSADFFRLFVDFKGYVDFFFLQDCVDEDYNVKLWLDTPLFEVNPIPKSIESYFDWIDAQLEFVAKRNERIAGYCKDSAITF